jgi:hypothetical protein
VTYLFEGALEHRDSLGNVFTIRAGDVNWMTAGRGIVHSERSPAADRVDGARLHGLQIWVALPQTHEETEPAFHHHPASSLPAFEREGALYRLIAGSAFGHQSPVRTFSPMFYLGVEAPNGSRIEIPEGYAERALYVAEGSLLLDRTEVRAGQLAIVDAGASEAAIACDDARVAVFGGAPLDGPRFVWWNFVSSSRDRIERAKADWQAQRFGSVVGETEFIPLPPL